MSTAKKLHYKIITTLVFALFAAVIFAVTFTAAPATADSAGVAALVPIGSASSEVTYHCFDAPNSVSADSAGLLVAGERSIEFISGETDVTATRKIAADKVYRHLEHGEHGEYIIVLRGGKIALYYGEQDGTALLSGGDELTGIIDFAVDGDTMYAVTSDALYTVALGGVEFDGEATKTVLSSARHTNIDVHGVATADGKVYVVVDSTFGIRHDICTVGADGALTVALMQSDTVLSITAATDIVYVLTRNDVTAYSTAANGGLIKRYSANGGLYSDIYAFGGSVYALDTLNALHKLSGDLSSGTTLFAASSDIKDYFNTPSGIAAKNSTLYVADTLNDRIAVYTNEVEYIDREFINPVSVACDSAGTVYVAYEYCKIGIFRDGDFSTANERTLLEPTFGTILQIVVNANKTLYILTDTGLWSLENNTSAPTKISDAKYKAIALGVGRDNLYALGNDKIYLLGDETAEKCAAPTDAVAFAVDLNGSVFMLTENSIVTHRMINGVPATREYSLTVGGERYSLGATLGKILLCTVSNNYVGHGDVIVLDTDKHRVFKTNGSVLGVKLVDDSYEVPELAASSAPEFYGNGLIRTTLHATEVFDLPMESQSVFTIARGRNVLVPQYSLDDAQEYALVLVDDIENGRLVQGYVFKDALSAPLPYSAPPAQSCAIFNAATPIYKFPSRHAKALGGYSAVDSATKFDMLDFVEGYRDDYGNIWYRLALDGGTEGYVLSINVSTGNYDPVYIHPASNAEIISYKGSEYAPGYILEDGVYTQVTQLPTGTLVEVVGAYDSSVQYTEIKYFDAERGTLTCYVETVYLKYNGVNIVLLVAIIVIVITVLLGSIIIGRVMHSKKKNLDNDETEEK